MLKLVGLIILLVWVLILQQTFLPLKLLDFHNDSSASYNFICLNPRYKLFKEGDSERYVNFILSSRWIEDHDGWLSYSLSRWSWSIIIYFNERRIVTRKTCGYW